MLVQASSETGSSGSAPILCLAVPSLSWLMGYFGVIGHCHFLPGTPSATSCGLLHCHPKPKHRSGLSLNSFQLSLEETLNSDNTLLKVLVSQKEKILQGRT